MSKKSINGYYKFYNKEGISCRIKCDDTEEKFEGNCIIKFKQIDDPTWMFHAPTKEFRNCLEVTNYILKNLENSNMVFKILPMQKRI